MSTVGPKGVRIRVFRVIVQVGAIIFLLGGLYGIPTLGKTPFLRNIFLPNASCRYISTAPTYCFFYPLQESLTGGYTDYFIQSATIVIIVTIMILLLGRVWCSWLCPLGFAQELLSDLRDLMGIPPVRLKWSQRALLREVKYAILFFALLISVSVGLESLGMTALREHLTLPYCQVCPAKGLFTLLQMWAGILPSSTSLPYPAIAVLIIFLVLSFFIRLFWCRICPMGALMSLFASKSLIYLRKDPDKCTQCRICLRVCPVDHDRVFEEMGEEDVSGSDCTLCGKCVEYCPEEGCLNLSLGSWDLVSSRKPWGEEKKRGKFKW